MAVENEQYSFPTGARGAAGPGEVGRSAAFAPPEQPSGFYVAYGKRILDVTLAGLLLVLTAPLLVVIAIAVVIDAPRLALLMQRVSYVVV